MILTSLYSSKKYTILGMLSASFLVFNSACSPTPNLEKLPHLDTIRKENTEKVVVNIAFDGSKSLKMWENTLSFSEINDVKFTYFIVGTHLLSTDNKNLYTNHRDRKGRSDVGFGGTKEEVKQRLNFIYKAHKSGHEIASHANGHWDGSNFTYDEWKKELEQFEYFLRNAYELNDLAEYKPSDWDEIPNNLIGFRAPLLAINENGYQALAELGYEYDTSFAKPMGNYYTTPYQGITGLPLHSIKYNNNSHVLSMDYNFYYKDKKNNADAYITMLESYNDYARYSKANLQPMSIGHHFSLWNNGQYWDALKTFIVTHCNTEDFLCITKRETLNNYKTIK